MLINLSWYGSTRQITVNPTDTIEVLLSQIHNEYLISYPKRVGLRYNHRGSQIDKSNLGATVQDYRIMDGSTILITKWTFCGFDDYCDDCFYSSLHSMIPSLVQVNQEKSTYQPLVQQLFEKHAELKAVIGYHVNNHMFNTKNQFFGYVFQMAIQYRKGVFPSSNYISIVEQLVNYKETSQFLSTLANHVEVSSEVQKEIDNKLEFIREDSEYRFYNVNNKYMIYVAKDVKTRELLIRQAALLKPLVMINNILPIYGFLQVPNIGTCLVKKFVPNNLTLREALQNGTIQQLNWNQRVSIAKGIIQGVAAIHLAGLLHLNLNPETILLDREKDTYIPRISGFTISTLKNSPISKNELIMAQPHWYYLAPEANVNFQIDSSFDIYALGMILYEIVKGFSVQAQGIQFEQRNSDIGFWRIIGGDHRIIPETISQVIEQCWWTRPSARPSIATIREAFEENKKTAKAMILEAFTRQKMPEEVNWDELNALEVYALYGLMTRIDINDVEAIERLLSSYNYAMGMRE